VTVPRRAWLLRSFFSSLNIIKLPIFSLNFSLRYPPN
jgi:hypothetical protein